MLQKFHDKTKKARFTEWLDRALTGAAGIAPKAANKQYDNPQVIVDSGIQDTVNGKANKWAGIWNRDSVDVFESVRSKLHCLKKQVLGQNGGMREMETQATDRVIDTIPLKKMSGMDNLSAPFIRNGTKDSKVELRKSLNDVRAAMVLPMQAMIVLTALADKPGASLDDRPITILSQIYRAITRYYKCVTDKWLEEMQGAGMLQRKDQGQ